MTQRPFVTNQDFQETVMEDSNTNPKRMSSWWKKSSSSTRLVVFMAPLVVVSVMVVLVGSGGSNGFILTNYNSWGFSDSTGANRSSRSADDGGALLDLRRSVTAGGEREKALAADYSNSQGSAAPPVSIEVGEVESPDEDQEEDETDQFPVFSDAQNATLAVEISPAPTPAPAITKTYANLRVVEAKLQQARTLIRGARNSTPTYDPEYVPAGPVYNNPSAFQRSYLEMEKHFKVYVYAEGEQPIFHNGPCGSIYSMEGNFIYKIETSSFRTRDPEKATVFFLPFSVASIVHFIFDRSTRGQRDHWLPMKRTVKDYVDLVAKKYPYWNRSLGSDHFMLSCHDWGPELSKSLPDLYGNSIRALCNANTTEGFRPSKDVSIPEINLPGGRTTGLIGGRSPSQRPILAFFAGGVHGPVRPILLEHWENKDPDIQVHKYLPKGTSYSETMRRSKYCICPSGYEVASPRIVEALYNGCVPVLISDHYVPPFGDVLNWRSFSVEIPVAEIPNMKNILMGISPRQYIRMQRRGVTVRCHFEVSSPPKRFDVFHMTLHSIWLRRLNLRLHGVEDS